MQSLKIGKRIINKDEPVFIIAEAGSNWRISNQPKVNKQQAFRLIDIAAEAKADAVKFQLYKAKKLYARQAGSADYIGKNKSIYKIIKEMELPYQWLKELKKYCDKKNIIFLCTPFDEESVDQLEKINIPAYKVASYSVAHLPLLKYIAKKGKPIIMSTGAANIDDIIQAIKIIKQAGNNQLALMQCTAKYPTPLSTLNLKVIPRLIKQLDIIVGLSDHSREPYIGPLGAVALGAKIIEKHYTTDNKLPGPDHGFAILNTELIELAKQIRKMEEALGSNKKEVQTAESELYVFTRPAIYATKTIYPGEKFTRKNIVVLRSGKTYNNKILLAKDFDLVLSRKAYKKITRDTGITRENIFDIARFRIRQLKQSDSLGIWRIRNLDEIRQLSNDTKPIPKNQHLKWFKNYIKNPENKCYILDYDGEVAGYCRIDHGLVSIALNPLFHGMGLGKKLLITSVNQIAPIIKKLKATIKLQNQNSLKLFTSVGFKIVKKNKVTYELIYQYEYSVRH